MNPGETVGKEFTPDGDCSDHNLDFDNRYYSNHMYHLSAFSMVNYFKQFSLVFDISFVNDYHLLPCQENKQCTAD